MIKRKVWNNAFMILAFCVAGYVLYEKVYLKWYPEQSETIPAELFGGVDSQSNTGLLETDDLKSYLYDDTMPNDLLQAIEEINSITNSDSK